MELEIEHYKEALNQVIIDELQDAREEFIHLSNPIDIRYDICAWKGWDHHLFLFLVTESWYGIYQIKDLLWAFPSCYLPLWKCLDLCFSTSILNTQCFGYISGFFKWSFDKRGHCIIEQSFQNLSTLLNLALNHNKLGKDNVLMIEYAWIPCINSDVCAFSDSWTLVLVIEKSIS